MAGVPLGGYSIYQGVDNLRTGNVSQGVLDVASGGATLASSTLGILGVTNPALAIAAGAIGMASAGNASAKAHGWYGTDDETGENHTFLGSIGETASDGWGLGHHVAGDGALGHVLGGWLAGWGGLGQTVLNTGAAAAGAVIPPMPWAGPRRNDGQLYYDDQGNPYTYHRPRRKQPAPPPPQGRYLDPTSVLGGTPVPSGLSVDEDGGDRVSAPALPPMLGPNPYEGLYDHCDEAAQVCYAE